MNIEEALQGCLAQSQSAPFLFVGSGFSRRYLGLEDWKGLLQKFSGLINAPFDYYSATANGDLPEIATLLSNDFHTKWWQQNQFEDNREAYKKYAVKKDSALKIEISDYMRLISDRLSDSLDLQEEIETLKEANIDGIITTNWDNFLKNLFPDFEVYVGQQQLLFSNPQSIAEIYKIHGCCSDPNSLVLTHEDYESFNEKNPYLAAKLLTVFVEHPVIFLGYSLTDKNIIRIINSIASCLTQENIIKLRNHLIFVQRAHQDADIGAETTLHHVDGFNIPVTTIKTKSFLPIYEVLAKNERRIPAKVLRQLKAQVTELVLTQDPHNRLHVLDIGNEDAKNVDVVFGVGAMSQISDVGYKALRASDLLKDLINQDRHFDANSVLIDALPDLLKSSSYVPIFKYLYESGRINEKRIDISNLDARVVKASQCLYESFRVKQNLKQAPKIQNEFSGVKDLVDRQNGHLRCLWQIPMLHSSQIDLIELRNVLRSFQHLLSYGERKQIPTDYRKLICLYDYLQYHPNQNR